MRALMMNVTGYRESLPTDRPAPAFNLPVVMSIPPFLAIVRDLKADAIWVVEKNSPVIGRVFGIRSRFRCGDAETAQLVSGFDNLIG